MKINNINHQNFNGIVRLNTSKEAALTIETRINNGNRQLRSIVCGEEKGDVYVLDIDNANNNFCYIATGKEAQEIEESYTQAINSSYRAKRFHARKDLFEAALTEIWSKHDNFVKSIFENTKISKTINVDIKNGREIVLTVDE